MTGQFASLDEDLTGRENLVLLARLWGFRGRRGARARRSVAGHVRSGGGGDQTGEGLFGRHAPPARHRRLAHRDAGRAVPRRADDGPRPGGAQECVGHDPPARGLGRHDPADDAVHGRGRPARGAHRRHRSRQEDRRGHAARTEGGHGLGLPARGGRGSRAARRSGARYSRRTSAPASSAASEGATLAIVAEDAARRERGAGRAHRRGHRARGFLDGQPESRRSVLRAHRKGANHERSRHRSRVRRRRRRSPTRWSSAGARCSSSSTCRSSSSTS